MSKTLLSKREYKDSHFAKDVFAFLVWVMGTEKQISIPSYI